MLQRVPTPARTACAHTHQLQLGGVDLRLGLRQCLGLGRQRLGHARLLRLKVGMLIAECLRGTGVIGAQVACVSVRGPRAGARGGAHARDLARKQERIDTIGHAAPRGLHPPGTWPRAPRTSPQARARRRAPWRARPRRRAAGVQVPHPRARRARVFPAPRSPPSLSTPPPPAPPWRPTGGEAEVGKWCPAHAVWHALARRAACIREHTHTQTPTK